MYLSGGKRGKKAVSKVGPDLTKPDARDAVVAQRLGWSVERVFRARQLLPSGRADRSLVPTRLLAKRMELTFKELRRWLEAERSELAASTTDQKRRKSKRQRMGAARRRSIYERAGLSAEQRIKVGGEMAALAHLSDEEIIEGLRKIYGQPSTKRPPKETRTPRKTRAPKKAPTPSRGRDVTSEAAPRRMCAACERLEVACACGR